VEGEVVNLGSNFEISIGELAKLIAEVIGTGIEIESDDERLRPEGSEVERLWADNTKAKRLIRWSPEFAGRDGLKRGLARTVEWFRDPANLARYNPGQYTL
jgi:dTDP-glucose 4,6-dehydratase